MQSAEASKLMSKKDLIWDRISLGSVVRSGFIVRTVLWILRVFFMCGSVTLESVLS